MNNLKSAASRLSGFKNPNNALLSILKDIYGEDSSLIERKIKKYITVLDCFIKKYGDREVVISRAPGRINLMGRHIEHRGGNINTIAIHKETIMVAAPRTDDRIHISNVDPRFGDFEFSISDELSVLKTDDWIEYIDSNEVKTRVSEHKGHWVNYVKSPALRFSFEYEKPLCGMDIMCLGTVPIAGGVSSSSSIVMATAELINELNFLSCPLAKFINLCGQSEWYVGSRGGAGDHAAIKCGEVSSFTPIAFEPINPLGATKIPDDYSIIVANSFIEAKKSEGAKDRFNQMVAAYEFGVMLIKKNFPQYAEKIIHLRDINPETLRVDTREIYKMLKTLPLYIKPDELYIEIPEEYYSKVRRITSSHNAPDAYNLRSAVLFGISECERSRICSSLLCEGKIDEFAGMMNISHNGDRVSGINGEYDYLMTDEKLDALIESGEELYKQPGGYACSVAEIDILIDKVLGLDGALGAQISGAGLGGCIMILCKKKNAQEILDFLKREYYDKNNFENGAIVVVPIKGSMCM